MMKEVASNFSGEISGSGPPAGNTVPVEIGLGLSGSSEQRLQTLTTQPQESLLPIVFRLLE